MYGAEQTGAFMITVVNAPIEVRLAFAGESREDNRVYFDGYDISVTSLQASVGDVITLYYYLAKHNDVNKL